MHTRDQIRAAVEKAELHFADIYPDSPKSGGGRVKTIRGMAIDHVAEKLGLQRESVVKAYQRSKREPRRQTKREVEHFDYLGVEVNEHFRRMLSSLLTSFRSAMKQLTVVKGHLTTAHAKFGLPEPKLKGWLEEFDSLYQRTKSMQPVGVCPWCKNTKTYKPNCAACFGTGWLTRAQSHAVPDRLRQSDVVIQHGHELKVKNLEQAEPVAEEQTEETFPWE